MDPVNQGTHRDQAGGVTGTGSSTGSTTTPSTGYGGASTSSAGAGGSGQSATDQLKHTAGQTAEQAKQKAADAMHTAQEAARPQVEAQKERVTEELDTVAQAVRAAGERLRENERDAVARYIEMGADRLERASRYLRDHDVGDLMSEAERLARRQPTLFVGGAFALGLLAARFLKSSSERAHQHDRGPGTYTPPNSYSGYGTYGSSTSTAPSTTGSSGTSVGYAGVTGGTGAASTTTPGASTPSTGERTGTYPPAV